MERYFYFGEATVETTGESCMFPLASFLGMTPAGAASTTISFEARNRTTIDDTIVVTHTGYTPKEFMTEIVQFLQSNHRDPFLVLADRTNPKAVTKMITSVAVTTT